MHCTLEAMTAKMNKHETFSGVISFDEQSFSYENHCECYKKLTSRLWHVLFIYIYIYIYIYLPDVFLYIHSHLLKKNKNLL